MFSDKPKNLYLVHGWKVGDADRNLVMFVKGEEAASFGISLTISGSGKGFFVGRLLGSVDVGKNEEYVGVKTPSLHEGELLKSYAKELGLSVLAEPLVYVVAG